MTSVLEITEELCSASRRCCHLTPQPTVGPCSCPKSQASCSTLPVGSARGSATVPEKSRSASVGAMAAATWWAGPSVEFGPDLWRYGRGNDQENDRTAHGRTTRPWRTFRFQSEGGSPPTTHPPWLASPPPFSCY